MRARFPLVFLFAFVAAWALAWVPREARAQTTTTASGPSVSGIVGVVTRLEPDGVTSADNSNENPHPNGVLVNDLNFADCNADLEYGFELGISSPSSGYNLNIWAGTQDCSVLANRQSATAVCWPVAPILSNAVTNPFPTTVRMRDIASQAFSTSHTVTYVKATDPNICQAQTTTGSQAISLYFFFADAEGNATGNVQPYPITLDMRSGNVQGNISIGVGDTILIVNVPTTTDTDTQGYNVYCDPAPGQDAGLETIPVDAATNNGVCPAGIPDSSTVVDGGVDDGSGLDAAADASDGSGVDSAVPLASDEAGGNPCGVFLNEAGIPSPGGCSVSSILVPGGGTTGLTEETDDAGNVIFVEGGVDEDEGDGGILSSGTMKILPSMNICGTGGPSSTKITVKGLTNGHFYNIAVATTDALGNVGPLSNVPCGEPVPVIDFWTQYYLDDGLAGGGFCSTEGVGAPVGAGGVGFMVMAGIVAISRRRRRK